MMFYEVAPIRIVRSNVSVFTYSSRVDLQVGQIVQIPIGKQSAIGIVMARVNKPSFTTKDILAVIDNTPVPASLIKLASWMAEYYQAPLATVLQTILPAGLQKKRRTSSVSHTVSQRNRTNIVLNNDQRKALETIGQHRGKTILIHGITGSGKTQVYIEAAKQAVASQQSAIILIPEIALTPQLLAEFQHHFSDSQLVLTHSKMTEAERHITWLSCLHTTTPLIVVGPRSALFSPLHRLGLIVIDEMHEPSYKQDSAPRYSTTRSASMLARYCHASLVLGSATPTIGDYYLARSQKAPIVRLRHLAKPTPDPEVHIVSLLEKSQLSRHRFLSNQLLDAINWSLRHKEQVLIFHNRRGHAPLTMCDHCGWTALCQRCHVPPTLHADTHQLVCHICTLKMPVPRLCPDCSMPDIIHKGIGTKQIVTELQKNFASARIHRYDTDSEISLQDQYQLVYDGDVDIIVGTQIVAKGLDLPHLSTVGIIQADSGLFLPDFAAEERVFQLLHQVVGRVGRNEKKSKVIVQTYQPDHPAIRFGAAKDYDAFYDYAVALRKQGQFPPFVHLLKLTCAYASEATAIRAAAELARQLRATYPDVKVLGPSPAFRERVANRYRWQLLIKSTNRTTLQSIASHIPTTKWTADLDPHSLL